MKKLISLALALALCLGLAVPVLAADFSDVPASHSFHDAITWCADRGIVGGYSDGTFQPTKTVTRSNFSVMLSRAFYADEVAANQNNPAYTQVSSTYPNFMALYNNGIVKNTDFETTPKLRSTVVMNKGITRYDMAMLMTNIMTQKGFAASSAEKNAIQSNIPDYNSIPSTYQDAVLNVYALGIIGGYADGSFNGNGIMNRGQACVVIYRMMQYSGNSGITTPSTPETPSTPTEPDTTKPTTIAVTSSVNEYDHINWEIADNGYETGLLNNGKPITQENILELMAEAEKIWPQSMQWGGDNNGIYPGNNQYKPHGYGTGASMSGMASYVLLELSNYKVSVTQGCGGFAAMLSDYIFGASNNNPYRKLDDNSKVRPGDMIIRYKSNGWVSHVSIAMSTNDGVTAGGKPGVKVAEGNSGGVVQWDTNTTNYPCRIDDYEQTAGVWSYAHIYTRYPD